MKKFNKEDVKGYFAAVLFLVYYFVGVYYVTKFVGTVISVGIIKVIDFFDRKRVEKDIENIYDHSKPLGNDLDNTNTAME